MSHKKKSHNKYLKSQKEMSVKALSVPEISSTHITT